jgi:hypothetical protein
MALALVVDFLEVFRSVRRANVKQRISSPFDLHQTSAKATHRSEATDAVVLFFAGVIARTVVPSSLALSRHCVSRFVEHNKVLQGETELNPSKMHGRPTKCKMTLKRTRQCPLWVKSGHQVLNQMRDRHRHAYGKQDDGNSHGN